MGEQLDTALSWQRLENARASRIAWIWDQPVTIMDTEEKLDELKIWAVDNYFKFRDVMSPYLENLPTTLADIVQGEQEPTESEETDEEDGVQS